MPSPEGIRSLDLVLTARCNLKCGYCYQNDKNAARMDWETLRASVDLLLASDRDEVEFTFYGGEPLLELPLIRRAVAYIEKRRAAKNVSYHISTNGMLLDEETAAFFAAHHIHTQLSFDGVPAAQALRGAATFQKLDALLDTLRVSQPRFYRDCLTINITLTCLTLDHLGDSVDYFFDKGVSTIDITPTFTHYGEWKPEMYDRLDAQFDRVRRASLEHYRRTGQVPVSYFRRTAATPEPKKQGRTMCGVPSGETLAVDVDGGLSGCVTLADSYQKYSAPFLRERVSSMKLGDLRDENLAGRLARFPETTRATGLFHAKQNKYSSYGRCGDCEYFDRCMVCPTSIGHLPGNTDPDRVPDFGCACQMIALSHQDRFPVQADTVDLLTGQAPVPQLMQELKRFVANRPRNPA